MADFAVKIDNLDVLQKLASKFPAVAEAGVDQAIRASFLRVLAVIKADAQNGAPVGVNAGLRDGWTQTFGRFYGQLSSTAPYAADVEFGTRPHWIGVKDNVDFQKWAALRGVNPYAVAYSIAQKGTKANPFFERGIDQATSGINTEFQKCADYITSNLVN